MYKIPALFIQLSRWWIKSWFFSNSQHQESHIPRKSLILNLKSLFWIVYLKFFPYNPQFCGSPAVKPYPHDPKPDPILTTVVHIAPTYSPCFRTEVHISKHIAKCIVFAYTKISQATMVVGNKLWETDCAVFVGWTEEKKRHWKIFTWKPMGDFQTELSQIHSHTWKIFTIWLSGGARAHVDGISGAKRRRIIYIFSSQSKISSPWDINLVNFPRFCTRVRCQSFSEDLYVERGFFLGVRICDTLRRFLKSVCLQ